MANMGGEPTVSGTVVWLTPPHIIKALGDFDLDPCAATNRPWDTAKHHFIEADDGLAQEWFGRVWCNPPYGPGMEKWLGKLAAHSGGGVALVFARTETKTFFDTVWGKASAIYFLKGRLRFHKPDGERGATAGSPSVLIAYGERERETLRNCTLPGYFVDLSND